MKPIAAHEENLLGTNIQPTAANNQPQMKTCKIVSVDGGNHQPHYGIIWVKTKQLLMYLFNTNEFNLSSLTDAQMRQYEEQKSLAKEARQQHALGKQDYLRSKEKLLRRKEKYNRVPEGILIYRLDTSDRTLQLLSPPHIKTNRDTLVESCLVQTAEPADDQTRRGLRITDTEGRHFTLQACEQRTATAWLEAIGLMDAKHSKTSFFGGGNRVR